MFRNLIKFNNYNHKYWNHNQKKKYGSLSPKPPKKPEDIILIIIAIFGASYAWNLMSYKK